MRESELDNTISLYCDRWSGEFNFEITVFCLNGKKPFFEDQSIHHMTNKLVCKFNPDTKESKWEEWGGSVAFFLRYSYTESLHLGCYQP
ncbi:hypothetical protein PFISCL1PPCAC_18870 [Pristionchus fissidentatus]|uniref:Galectin n=1 Tax=Pristionchus fissidentatus TaxID=1538716 RepID=A0AAV5W7P8_9BILA|nr:hypothetical protein PFISCL1PPCAC_18870 [Pristionchus fissidentatus]